MEIAFVPGMGLEATSSHLGAPHSSSRLRRSWFRCLVSPCGKRKESTGRSGLMTRVISYVVNSWTLLSPVRSRLTPSTGAVKGNLGSEVLLGLSKLSRPASGRLG